MAKKKTKKGARAKAKAKKPARRAARTASRKSKPARKAKPARKLAKKPARKAARKPASKKPAAKPAKKAATALRIVLLGPPGAGKGTQAQKLLAHYDVPQISTGDILRAERKAGTEIGKTAQSYMDSGKLVPDELILGLVERELEKKPKGYILDGFPRTVPQAEALDEMLERHEMPLEGVIELTVDYEEIVRRAVGRRSSPGCGAMYHVTSNPPKVADVCDKCGDTLVQRPDDREEVVRQRITEYEAKTAPLRPFYESSNRLKRVDGIGEIDAVLTRIRKAIGHS